MEEMDLYLPNLELQGAEEAAVLHLLAEEAVVLEDQIIPVNQV
jgi:hypothetical protein